MDADSGPVTVGLQVTNGGGTPEGYFADARLDHQVTADLAAQTTSTPTLPAVSTPPTYLVPSHTTGLTAAVSSSRPLFFAFSWEFGDPDLISTIGTTATGAYSASPVADGDWAVTPFLLGPTQKASKHSKAEVSMTATTAAFDPAVSSPTGDLWLGSTDAKAGFTPYVVEPGQTITIPVTITPEGRAGSTVTGTVYIDDASAIPGQVAFNELTGTLPEGSDVAAFRYGYTIR